MPKLPPIGSCTFFIPLKLGVIIIGAIETIFGLVDALVGFIAVAPGAEDNPDVIDITKAAERVTASLGKSGPVILLLVGLYELIIGIIVLVAVCMTHLKLLRISWILRALLAILCFINFIAQIVLYFTSFPDADPVLGLCFFVMFAYFSYIIYSHHYKLSEHVVTASQPE